MQHAMQISMVAYQRSQALAFTEIATEWPNTLDLKPVGSIAVLR